MTELFGLSLQDLQALCEAESMPKFTARQIANWLYDKRVDSIDAMTNLSLKQRARLKEICTLKHTYPADCQVSTDGTKKYIFDVGDRRLVETVFIPDGDRATLCVSCQVGCKMGCRFCVTGSQGFHGSLSAYDILNQIFAIPEFSRLTNIVYMGMGEPFDNYDAVMRSIGVLTSGWGLGWSPHRITVSTVGVVPGIERFLHDCDCHLAISLHNPIADERLSIMPMQKTYPIAKVVAKLKEYDWSGQRRLSFEYTMFGGLNDDLSHAESLVRLLKPLHCRVNLIRFHTSPDTPFHTSPRNTMQQFMDYLVNHGIRCTIRASRGEDIMAACGLLAGSVPERAER